MGYKLFIDDLKDPPGNPDEWVVVRSSAAAIAHVKEWGPPGYISFDHDLGGEDTSIVFIDWLIGQMLDLEEKGINLHWVRFPSDYYIHSENPIGRDNIDGKMIGFFRYMWKI